MNPWHSLKDKTIWVAGGAGYLGSAITRELDREAAKVICIDLTGKAEALVAQARLARTIPVSCNLADAAALPDFIADTVAKHGVPDGHVHLTYASSSGKRLEELSVADFQGTLDQALPPTFVLCRALADAMKPLGRGSIVLFSSMYGVVSPDPRIYHAPMAPNPIDYGAAKAALLQISRYFAVHYGPAGIRFNCITPGPFPNPGVQAAHPPFIGDLARKTALNRVGQSSEIVGPALFLLTDSASYVTGHTLAVDGGWTAW
jgi:NAD(P)-dependent dehydrogenase (short-subunit alcohol dehydrogenase family)